MKKQKLTHLNIDKDFELELYEDNEAILNIYHTDFSMQAFETIKKSQNKVLKGWILFLFYQMEKYKIKT